MRNRTRRKGKWEGRRREKEKGKKETEKKRMKKRGRGRGGGLTCDRRTAMIVIKDLQDDAGLQSDLQDDNGLFFFHRSGWNDLIWAETNRSLGRKVLWGVSLLPQPNFGKFRLEWPKQNRIDNYDSSGFSVTFGSIDFSHKCQLRSPRPWFSSVW